MMRSLFSGVSGLKNSQTRMDVIGNNISNVNTTGFKAGRATFQDILSQTITGASSAQGNLGGTNPKQIGLGMGISSIDTLFTDGSVQSTGKNTDLCLSGSGFFIVANGSNQYYTRNGAFSFDTAGNYVNSAGLKVQGWMADSTGTINSNSGTTNITIPVGQTMAATATTKGTYSKNLDAKATSGTTTTAGLTQAKVISNLGLTSGSTDYTSVISMASGDTVNLSDGKTTVSYDGTNYTTKVKKTTDTTIPNLTKPLVLSNLKIATGSPDETAVNGLATANTSATLSSGATVAYSAATGKYTMTTPSLTQAQAISNLGLTTGSPDAIAVNGLITAATITLSDGVTTVACDGAGHYTTMQPGVTQVQVISKLGLTAGSADYNSVTGLNSVTLSDGTTKVSYDGTNYTTTTSVAAAATAVASFAAYDSEGVKHTITGTFTKSKTANEWTFSAGTTTDTGCAITGGSYTITFNADGTYKSATGTQISFNPADAGLGGAAEKVDLDFSKMTQFDGDTTIAVDKDGNAAGSLDSVSTDSSGIIVGSFSNGLKQNLAQVAVATFNNPGGLTKSGDSLYSSSNNSGSAQINTAGTGGAGKLTPSSLEMSNVDLSDELTNMIITQRGFQASSKIITTSDEMLETLVGLKR